MPDVASAEDVLKHTKLKPKDGESSEYFTVRVAKDFHKASQKAWDALPEPVQYWTNQVMETTEPDSDKTIDVLLPVAASDEGGADAEADEGGDASSSEEESDVEHVNGKKAKANGKSKAAAKPAKEAAKPKEKPAKVAKEPKAAAKAAKEKPAKAAKDTNKLGRKPQFDPGQKIKLLVKDNPHREGTGRFKRWSKYKDGMTVEQAIAAGLKYVNLHYSVKDGHIKIA